MDCYRKLECVSVTELHRHGACWIYTVLWEDLVFEILISEGISFASSAAAFSAAGRLCPRPRCDSFHGLEVEHAVPLISGVHFGFFYSWSSSKICLSLLESTHANPVAPESFKSTESEWGWGMVNSRVEMLVPFCNFTDCQKCLKSDVLLWFYLLSRLRSGWITYWTAWGLQLETRWQKLYQLMRRSQGNSGSLTTLPRYLLLFTSSQAGAWERQLWASPSVLPFPSYRNGF